jgi:hypothetical protein
MVARECRLTHAQSSRNVRAQSRGATTMQFTVHFHRYASKTGVSLKSAAWHTQAEDFRSALRNAELFMAGMKEGGCTDEVAVSSIECLGYRGEQCVSSITIWHTAEEHAAWAESLSK